MKQMISRGVQFPAVTIPFQFFDSFFQDFKKQFQLYFQQAADSLQAGLSLFKDILAVFLKSKEVCLFKDGKTIFLENQLIDSAVQQVSKSQRIHINQTKEIVLQMCRLNPTLQVTFPQRNKVMAVGSSRVEEDAECLRRRLQNLRVMFEGQKLISVDKLLISLTIFLNNINEPKISKILPTIESAKSESNAKKNDPLFGLFISYCKQSSMKLSTFQQMQHSFKVMNFKKFNKFINDHSTSSISVDKKLLMSLFERHSANHQLEYSQFTHILRLISKHLGLKYQDYLDKIYPLRKLIEKQNHFQNSHQLKSHSGLLPYQVGQKLYQLKTRRIQARKRRQQLRAREMRSLQLKRGRV